MANIDIDNLLFEPELGKLEELTGITKDQLF